MIDHHPGYDTYVLQEVTGSRPGDNEEEEEDDCSHFTIPSWISTRLFQEIVCCMSKQMKRNRSSS